MARWVLLAYRLPREPSTPRIGVWRQLRRLGVAQISDGLVAVPLDARTRERLEWLAGEVVEHGGEATVWIGQPGSAAQERGLIDRMTRKIERAYEAIEKEARSLLADQASSRRTVARLRRELRRVELGDHFPSPARQRANAAVDLLGQALEAAS